MNKKRRFKKIVITLNREVHSGGQKERTDECV